MAPWKNALFRSSDPDDPVSARTYAYSSENLLTSASGGVTLAYDPELRLYQVAGGSGTTRFAYDGLEPIAEYDGSNALQRRYVFDDRGNPVVWYEGSGLSQRRFLAEDQLGSVITVTDSGANAIAVNTYDEYGIPAATNIGRFQYTGQMWIGEIGQYAPRFRNYGAHLGRFSQTDPIGHAGGVNLYAYVLNDPVNLTDPLGLSGCDGTDPGANCGEIVVTACQNGGTAIGNPQLGYICIDFEEIHQRLSWLFDPIDRLLGPAEPGADDSQNNQQCPTGPRITYGGGPSFTGVLGVVGLSGSISGNITLPRTPSGSVSLSGAQLSVTGSLTPLAGLGLFAATGASGSASSSTTAAPLFSGSITPVLQVGASDGLGAEVVRAINSDPLDWGGSGGRIGTGGYGAVGARFTGTITSPAWGCTR